MYNHELDSTRPFSTPVETTAVENPPLTKKIDNKENNYIKNFRASAEAHDRAFDEFYKIYPRKKNPKAARKAWKKIDPEKIPMIMEKLKRQMKEDHQWQDAQFIPHPSTYLNGERWEDEITQHQAPKTNSFNKPNEVKSTVPFYVKPVERPRVAPHDPLMNEWMGKMKQTLGMHTKVRED